MINASRSLPPTFSVSLSSFLETKFFLSNGKSLCALLNVFLFSWCCTNSFREQLIDNKSTVFLCLRHLRRKNLKEAPLKMPLKSEKLFECKRCTILIGSGKAFTLSLIGYTCTHETAVRHSDWLYRLFSHVKVKRIDFYKWPFWNKILVSRVINCTTIYEIPFVWGILRQHTLPVSGKSSPSSKISPDDPGLFRPLVRSCLVLGGGVGVSLDVLSGSSKPGRSSSESNLISSLLGFTFWATVPIREKRKIVTWFKSNLPGKAIYIKSFGDFWNTIKLENVGQFLQGYNLFHACRSLSKQSSTYKRNFSLDFCFHWFCKAAPLKVDIIRGLQTSSNL